MKSRLYEYRLLWAYKGRKSRSVMLAQRPGRILRHLKRVATDKPWEGATLTAVRKGWVRLSLMLDVPFDTVADLPAREVMTRIQAAYPTVDFIRVEWRQVGEWTELIDPLANLVTAATASSDRRLESLYARLDSMSTEELNLWRLLPPDKRGDLRPTAERMRHSHAKQRERGVGRRPRGFAGIAATPDTPGDSGGTGNA